MTETRDLKGDAREILNAALREADAAHAVRLHFRKPEGDFKRITVVAVGKAAYVMAEAVIEVVSRPVDRVLVITKHGHAGPPRAGWEVFEAGHPVPDENGLHASYAVRDLAISLTAHDLLIVAVSGGASALLPAPCEPVTLQDKQQTTQLLLRAGANIYELNAVRRQLSFLKGGRLAELAFPARVIGLILSDVVGDPLDVIGSGLTVCQTGSVSDGWEVLRKYQLWDKVPASVRERLNARIPLPRCENVENVLIGSNRLALTAAARRATELGYAAGIISDCVEGEAVDRAREHAVLLKNALPGSCSLSGGETTVTVTGNGKGGRNQEFALALAMEIAGDETRGAICAGTDGTDGPTDAAGAYVDGATIRRGRDVGLNAQEYLNNNDSYTFFERLDDLVKTGPTGTNVMDINIMLVRKS